MDSVSDALADGRRFRALTVIDDFTRECPAIEVDHALSGERVVRVLEAHLPLSTTIFDKIGLQSREGLHVDP